MRKSNLYLKKQSLLLKNGLNDSVFSALTR